MRNQGRNRRSRGQKDQDADQFNALREEPHSAGKASYPRHHHDPRYGEPHRSTTSTSSGMGYDMPRDRNAESSRNIRDEGWGLGAVGHDRFDYTSYHHPEHDSYDGVMRRDPEGWRGNAEPPYSSRGDWDPSYHPGDPSASYPESSAWNPAAIPGAYPDSHIPRTRASPSYRTPNAYYDDGRLEPHYDTTRGYYPDDGWSQREPLPEDRMDYASSEKPRNHGWLKQNRRDKGGQQKFQSDQGWSTRKKGKEHNGDGPAGWVDAPMSADKYDGMDAEDRAWVPAEAWKSGHRASEASPSKQQSQQQHHREGGRQNQKSNKSKPKSKKGQSSKKDRDWRVDDNTNLNNWTRRDASNSSKKSEKQSSSSRRKHARSPSRSRSHSLESIRSARSSYAHSARSRSSSPVPKKRRRDRDLSPDLRSQSSRERERDVGWLPRDDDSRVASRSPSPYRSPKTYLRRSPTYSDMSSPHRRSRSTSPVDNRRPHRLPAVVPAPTPAVGPTNTEGSKKKKKRKKDRGRQRQAEVDRKDDSAIKAMPPPPAPLSGTSAQEQGQMLIERPSKMTYPPPPQASAQPEPTRISIRNAGFKPIGKPDSALKRFFPGDDDDTETTNVVQPPTQERHPASPIFQQNDRFQQAGAAPAISPALAPTTAPPPAPIPHSTNGHYPQNGYGAQYPPTFVPDQNRPHWPVPPPTPIMVNGYPMPRFDLNVNPSLPSTPMAPMPGWPPRHPHAQWQPDTLPLRHVPSLPQSAWPPPPPTSTTVTSSGLPSPLESPKYSPVPQPCETSSTQPSPKREPAKEKERDPPPHITKNTGALAKTIAGKAPSLSVTEIDPKAEGAAETSSRPLYSVLNQVGEGTFGKVYKAQNTSSKMYVALKRIRMETEKDGFPVTAMREIKLLQSLKHPNVVRLHEMMVSNGSVFMVFEYMDHDLTGILSQSQFKFSAAHLKSLCHQMLAGLAYLHHKGVIHRDIKGSNILLNNRGELKLADFGLARFYQKRRRSDYTNRVITLWYRPPELLFGATVYGAEVDMWSAGCIMLELFTKKPVFQGNDELHQLQVIFKIMGTPSPDRWLGLLNLPWYELVKPREALPNRFRDLFQKWMSPAALDLAEQLLAYDPEQRISAVTALEAPYFNQEQPPAERPVGLATLEGEWHELETKVERQKKRRKEGTAA
ncbi:hypothetical protein NMY22_g3701 [Coprinellus aureogranulatus]|nr:hypothetical protein NMY22_g3701 [Coprinellus aureogranulatus]